MISGFYPVLYLRMKSSCNVRMCPPDPHATWHPHVSTLLCSTSSWNSCRQALSLADVSLIFMVLNSLKIDNIPNRVTSSHLPDPACITRTNLGETAKQSLLFCLQHTSPHTSTLRGDGHQLLLTIFQKPSKNTVRPAASQPAGKTLKLEPETLKREPQAQIAICHISNNHYSAAHLSLICRLFLVILPSEKKTPQNHTCFSFSVEFGDPNRHIEHSSNHRQTMDRP